MQGLFDTHAHFPLSREDTVDALKRAKLAGVEEILAVGGDNDLNRAAKIAAEVVGGASADLPKVYLAQGYDMSSVAMERPKVDYTRLTAVGELGLDYSHGETNRAAQCQLLASQLEDARHYDLPVIIHTREADADTLGVLREVPSRGVIHCFTGTPTFCRELLDLGFYISISGIVTFKKAENVRESARYVPDDRLLIETDSPYLAPIPYRGKQNEPAFIVETARYLANLRGTSFETLAALTTTNAHNCFATMGAR